MILFASLAHATTVAVLYFQNQGNPQLEPLKVGLAQMLTTDLQGSTKIVERAQLQAVLDELKLGHSGVVDKDTAAKVGKLLGADELVLGSYFEMMGTLRVDARLVKVETGEVLYAAGADGPSASFLELEKKVAAQFRDHLAPPAAPPSTPPATQGASAAVVPPDTRALDAAMAFSNGLISLDQKDLARARASFEEAVADDPRLEAAKAQLAAMSL
jgi:TolB-like protein